MIYQPAGNMSEIIGLHQIKRTPWSAARQLTIDPLYLECGGPLTNTRFTKEDIECFRFGSTVLQYYFFKISRTYNLEIKNSQGKVMLIRMHTFFGIGNKRIEALFGRIYDQIYMAYFNDMALHYVRLLNTGLTYELAGTFISEEGILLKNENQLIPWARVGLASYYYSCSVYDQRDPKHSRSFDYWHDWNASLLRAVVDYMTRKINSRKKNRLGKK